MQQESGRVKTRPNVNWWNLRFLIKRISFPKAVQPQSNTLGATDPENGRDGAPSVSLVSTALLERSSRRDDPTSSLPITRAQDGRSRRATHLSSASFQLAS